MIETLYQSTVEFAESYPPKSGLKEGKKVKNVHHVGFWRKDGKMVFKLNESKNEHTAKWIKANTESGLFKTLRDYVRTHMGHLFKAYESANVPEERDCPPSNMVAINYGTTQIHRDDADPKFGQAFVLPFGKFSGGGTLMLDSII